MEEHGSMQAETVLESELRVLHLDLQAAEATMTLGVAWVQETSKPTATVTHFPQQGQSYSKKATPSNSATPYGDDFLSNYHTDYRSTSGWMDKEKVVHLHNGILLSC